MQLAKLRWLGRGKYVELTLHCSAKAIMRHTWLDIRVSQPAHNPASISRRFRMKVREKIEKCAKIGRSACLHV